MREREFGNQPAPRRLPLFLPARVCASSCAREIHAQFERFRATGLPLDHVNGHLHLHLHPTVFGMLMADAGQLGIRRLRLTCDPFWLNLRLASGALGYRAAHAAHLSLPVRARPAGL